MKQILFLAGAFVPLTDSITLTSAEKICCPTLGQTWQEAQQNTTCAQKKQWYRCNKDGQDVCVAYQVTHDGRYMDFNQAMGAGSTEKHYKMCMNKTSAAVKQKYNVRYTPIVGDDKQDSGAQLTAMY